MKCAVTGAYGYSGRYIAQRLLSVGCDVITLTNSSQRDNPFGERVKAYPFHFDQPDLLTQSLRGVDALINTYWVRFNSKNFTYADAIRNSETLFRSAREAGVRRVVHVSITNPSESSPLEYFRGKAILERRLIDSGLSYAILRPAVLFGKEDVLINNIAWALRHLPVFGVFGDGQYKLQPIYVDDLAALAVEQARATANATIDAIGPETFTFRDLVKTIGEIIGKRKPVLSVPPRFGYWMGKMIGWLMNDVFVTRDEIAGLMANQLFVASPPAGSTKLSEWAHANADTLGRRYASEMARRTNIKQSTLNRHPERSEGSRTHTARDSSLRQNDAIGAIRMTLGHEAKKRSPDMERPEVPLEQTQEEITHHAHTSGERWILGVALTAAFLAVMAAIAALLAEHHANEAMLERIKSSDHWSEFQANSIKQFARNQG